MMQLTIVNGPYTGRRLGVNSSAVVIGREEGCDVVLPHDWVSRRHCRLFCHGHDWFITDLGSANGVCVNGARVTGTVRLAAADLIAIGPLVLRFEVDRYSATADADPADGEAVLPSQEAEDDDADPEADPIRLALAPDVSFVVTLAAVLRTQQEITHNGKMTLRALARRGALAADRPFDGRLSGRFNLQFLVLDGYDLTGQASCILRVGLLLPKKTWRRRREWVAATVQCKVEHAVSVCAATGLSLLDRKGPEVHLDAPTRTISATESGADPDATGRITSWPDGLGLKLPYDVPPEALLARLTDLCDTCAAAGRGLERPAWDLNAALTQHCLEAADMYREWYHRNWQEQARTHDSQLPVGELRYEFDVHGELTDRPKARTLGSVYRWV